MFDILTDVSFILSNNPHRCKNKLSFEIHGCGMGLLPVNVLGLCEEATSMGYQTHSQKNI